MYKFSNFMHCLYLNTYLIAFRILVIRFIQYYPSFFALLSSYSDFLLCFIN